MDKTAHEASREASPPLREHTSFHYDIAGALNRDYAAMSTADQMHKFPDGDRLLRDLTPSVTSGDRHQVRLHDAIVDVPNNLDPSKPIHFMNFFNGFGSGFSEGYKDYKLQDAMKNAPPNTVLISARWQDHENSRDPSMGRFEQHGGLHGVMNDVFASVPELRRAGGLKPDDDIGLTGFSAGYNPVGNALADRQLAARVNNIVMLDSPSSAVRQYVYDHIAAFSNGNKRLTMVAGDWRNSDYHEFQREVTSRMHGVLPPTVRFGYTHAPHLDIPGLYFREGL